MEEQGSACTADEQTFRELLRSFDALSEQQVAEALGVMARTHSPQDGSTPVRPLSLVGTVRAACADHAT